MASLVLLTTQAKAAARDPAAEQLPAKDTRGKEVDGQTGAGHQAVSLQGAATFSVPIVMPPGRNGATPSLALTYSSSYPTRGGVAVGWRLETPTIEIDPVRSTVGGSQYLSHFGDGGRLVPNQAEPASSGGLRYRAEHDASFAQYTFYPATAEWLVRTLDGKTYTFAAHLQSTRWHLTRVEDSYGNEVIYHYAEQNASGYRELLLTSIEYTRNSGQGIAAHAQVELDYAPLLSCGNGVPMGAELDRRFGVARMQGSRRLNTIQTYVKDTSASGWRPVRRYALHYDQAELNCTASGLSYLERIEQTAYGADGAVSYGAPLRFAYGPKQRALDTEWTVSGARQEEGSVWGPTRMLRDFDGDGWLDELTMETGARCTLAVRPGRGVLQFAADNEVRRYPLRSAEWYNGASPTGVEKCTLAGQIVERPLIAVGGGCRAPHVVVNYRFVDWDGDGLLDVLSNLFENYEGQAPRDFGRPVSYSQPSGGNDGCTDHSHRVGTLEGTPVCQCDENYHPMEGDGCGICPADTIYDPVAGRCNSECEFQGPAGCDFRNPVTPPSGPGGGAPQGCAHPSVVPQRTQVDNLGGEFVYRLQRNNEGALAPVSAAQLIVSPVPLPAQPMHLLDLTPNWTDPELPALVDLNGDGFLDMVSLYADPRNPGGVQHLGTAPQLYVWLGHGGGFDPAARLRWSLPTWAQADNMTTWDAALGFFSAIDTARLIDWNGDGLPDLVVQLSGTTQLAVAYNEGLTDSEGGRFSALSPLNVFTSAEVSRTESAPEAAPPPILSTGLRGVLSTLIDVDGDGLPELFTEEVGSGSLMGQAIARRAWRFSGGLLYGVRDLGPEWEALEESASFAQNAWQRRSDYLDVTGDGVPDAVTWGYGVAHIRTGHNAAMPARLLTEVQNGQGGVTRFVYAPTTDASVVKLEGKRLAARSVVRSVLEESGSAPTRVTSYEYAAPHYGPDSPLDVGPIHFLGFERVTTFHSGQEGWDSSRQIARNSFAPVGADWRGHLVAEALVAKRQDGGEELESVTTTEWAAKPGIAAFAYPATKTEHRCTGAMGALVGGMPSCVPVSSLVTSSVWVGIGPNYGGDAGPMAYGKESETVAASDEPAASYTHFEYEVRPANWLSLAAGYRVFTVLTEKGALAGGQTTILAKSATEFDARGLPIRVHQYSDATHYGTKTSTFTATGMLGSVQTPEQTAAGTTTKTVYEYDDRELFARKTTDALKLETEVGVDLGTGAKLWIRGPQKHRVCGTAECKDVAEYREQRVDGFGRVVETRLLVEAPYMPDGTTLRSVSFSNYIDTPTAVATTVDVQDLLAATLIRTQTQFDGAGRPQLITKLHWNDSMQNAEQRFEYDSRGDLVTARAPDPRAQTSPTQVMTTYVRDGLGRVVSEWRPDGSGFDMAYSGLSVVRSDRDTLNAKRETLYSARGQVRQVAQWQDNGTATTQHTYDPLGRPKTLIDADGVKTTFQYDWLGQRTQIARDDRHWSVQYDRDGHVVAVTKPMPSGANLNDYTSTRQYDLAGRLLVEAPATLGRSASEQQRLGLGARTFSYDGHLPKVTTLPFGELESTYDLRGRLVRSDQRLQVPQTQVASNQYYTVQFDDADEPVAVQWDNGTQWHTRYDQMGRVERLEWLDPSIAGFRPVAEFSRNPAGLPYARNAYNGVQRQWHYSALGRVTYDRIVHGSDTLAERNYAYDSNELTSVWGSTLKDSADATYQYDRAHRLLGAVGPAAYHGAFTYSAAGNVATANVRGAMDVPDRNVSYVYSTLEPQAVERLHSLGGGNDPLVASYDLEGNLVERTTAAGTFSYQWDGENQLREVAGPSGTETYYFGPRGQRLAAVGSVVKVWFGASETRYAATGAQLKRWQHLSAGEPVARIEDGQQLELQFVDVLQNLMLAVDGAGTPSASFLYGAFGEAVSSTGETNHSRRFNSKEHDAIADLRHYGYRSYDPLTLRWTAADPLFRFAPEEAGEESNLYAFSRNNPVRYFDPDGRQVAPSDDKTTKPPSFLQKVGRALLGIKEQYERENWPKVKQQLQDPKFMQQLQKDTLDKLGPLYNAAWGPMPGTGYSIGYWTTVGKQLGDKDAEDIWNSVSSEYISELTYFAAIVLAPNGFDTSQLQRYELDPVELLHYLKENRAEFMRRYGGEEDAKVWDQLTAEVQKYQPL